MKKINSKYLITFFGASILTAVLTKGTCDIIKNQKFEEPVSINKEVPLEPIDNYIISDMIKNNSVVENLIIAESEIQSDGNRHYLNTLYDENNFSYQTIKNDDGNTIIIITTKPTANLVDDKIVYTVPTGFCLVNGVGIKQLIVTNHNKVLKKIN